MTNETLKEEWENMLSVYNNRPIEFGKDVRDVFADWWLAKMQEHDALLLRRLEEMKNRIQPVEKLPEEDVPVFTRIDLREACNDRELRLIEDIKLLITNKEV
jgi:hypothetical protein